ncbi:MAG: tRNA lysidine(34) synthetase TilS [Paracoccaceae bacterium]
MIFQKKIEYEFQKQMEALDDQKVGLAVSGGGDSIAMLVLASKWAQVEKKKIQVVTVNHNLRKEAKEEAIFTREFVKKLGHIHTILEWKRPSDIKNLQSDASFARKKLISNWAKLNNIKTILVAHTLDDQVETILMRFARGSGVDGLVGMRKIIELQGKYWFRPLLTTTRNDLRKFLKIKKVSWVEDPTNEDRKYLRVKSRDVISQLKKIGINTDLLINTSLRMENARNVLNDVAIEAFNMNITLKKWGDIEVNREIFYSFREDTYLRILAGIIKGISGNIYRPRYKDLLNFAEAINNKNFKARTLCGVLARSLNEKKIVLRREPCCPMIISELSSNKFIWDGRWQITATRGLKKFEHIGPLGIKGYIQIKNHIVKNKSTEGVLSTPTLFRKDIVISAPMLKFGTELSCKLKHNKKQFINCFILH